MLAALAIATRASVVTDRAPLTVDRVSDVAVFRALEPEWDELLEASDSRCVFLTWAWLFTWWKHLAEDRRLSILTVRRGNELIAIAPFCLKPRGLFSPLPTLEFLGSGFAGSDYLDVIVRRGSKEAGCAALTSHLAQRRLAIKLTNLKLGENIAATAVSELSSDGWTTAETRTNTCPFIPLSCATWDSYLASLSADHRYNFNRKLRRLNQNYAVSFDQIGTTEQCAKAIDLLIAQHNTRWQARGGSDAFHTASLVAFHREWTQLALDRGWLRLYVLRLDDQPAACLYGLLYRGIFYFYQSSFDAAYTLSSVGLISMGLAIRGAIEEGAEEYDLLHGSEAYKSHWSRESRDLVRQEAFPPGVLGEFSRRWLDFGRASRALVRRITERGRTA